MTMQTMPGSPFEVVEAEFFLELLMRLFADPTRLDCCGKGFQIGVGGQIGEIILMLA